jgi:hypothetical protein
VETCRRRSSNYALLLEPGEALAQVARGRPALIGDEVAGNIYADLHRQHQVERHEVQDVAVCTQCVGTGWPACVNAADAVAQLGELLQERHTRIRIES